MKIGIIGSMHFSEEMLEIAEKLKNLGHEPILSNFINSFPNKNDLEKEKLKLKQKFEENAMKKDWDSMKVADILLVVNLKRHGIENYIGGNTLFELAAGYFSGKKIYFYNPIPEIHYYKTELEAIEPIVIYGDLTRLR